MTEYNVFGEDERLAQYERSLSSEEAAKAEFGKFKEWAPGYVLMLHNTSQVPSDPHQKLLGQKGGGGFPFLVFMDADGNVLSEVEGRTVDGLKDAAGKATAAAEELAALKKKADGGDDSAKKKLLLKRLEMHGADVAEATEALKKLKWTDEERKELGSKIADLEVNEALGGVTRDRKTQVDAGKRFSEMWKAGRIPSGEQETLMFWYLIMICAEEEKDVGKFESALSEFKGKFGDNARYKKFIETQEKTLERLKGDK